jgi:hypothetical protein
MIIVRHKLPSQPSASVRLSQPSYSPQSVIQTNRPSQVSETLSRGNRPSQPSESSVGVSQPSQSSGLIVWVHRRSRSSESAVQPSQTEQTTSRSLLVQPMIRPVEPRQPKPSKRPRTVSASHTFDTNDPLQEPPPKRQSTPQEHANDVWTQWRNLAKHGRRSSWVSCTTPSIWMLNKPLN